MRNEIGSEFWNIPIAGENHIFPDNTNWFISGRSALKAILTENNFKNAMVPMWCCDSMIKPFVDAGIKVSFYTDKPKAADVALVMDYFGYISGKTYENYPGVVIRDVTHSLLSKQYDDADYYFGSLRKWAGFWTGGYAWGYKNPINYVPDTSSYIELRKKAMNMKSDYISGKTESKEYLRVFDVAEEELENIGILPAAERDIQAAMCLDVDKIKAQRRKNAEILLSAFREKAIWPFIGDNDCPMFVPIRTDGRNGLKKYLIQQEIYCPVHWPVSNLHSLDSEAEELYGEELSLVCDQRYTEEDMMRIVSAIEKYYTEEEVNQC